MNLVFCKGQNIYFFFLNIIKVSLPLLSMHFFHLVGNLLISLVKRKLSGGYH